MATIDVSGVEVYFRDVGRGPAVVLLHSSSSTGGQWRQLIASLQDRYRVLTPDFLGYGRSGWWPDSQGPVMAGEVAIAEAMLGLADGPVHLVGHSMGGSIAGRVALTAADRLASLTMIEPTLFHLLPAAGEATAYGEIYGVAQAVIHGVDKGELEAATEVFIDYWVGSGALKSMPTERREVLVGTIPKLRQEWPCAFEGVQPAIDDFAAMRSPTLLVEGSRTTLAASRVVQILKNALPAMEHRIVESAGHMSPISHSDAVNALIEAHIVRHS